MRPFATLLLCGLVCSSAQAVAPSPRPPRYCSPVPVQTEVHASGFKLEPGQRPQAPLVRYEIGVDGRVRRVRVVRGTGIKEFDRQLAESIAAWEYKPRPANCGVVDSEIEVEISLDLEGNLS